MAWRVIVRVGINSDDNSVIRNKIIEPQLLKAGLSNTATGTWECGHADQKLAAVHLGQLLTQLSNPSAHTNIGPQTYLKHLWIYIDYVADPLPNTSEDDD